MIRGLRDALATDLQRNEAILNDYRAAQKTAAERVPQLERLTNALQLSLNSSGGLSLDAQQR